MKASIEATDKTGINGKELFGFLLEYLMNYKPTAIKIEVEFDFPRMEAE